MEQGIQYFLHERKYYRIIYVRSMNETFKGKTMMTKSERLVEALKKGEQLTAAQIKARFGIANPTATVSDLRLRGGFAVYANEHTDTKGRVSVKYRLGTPSRAVVAAGYRALAQQA
jgi:predicted ArsR family transcriptional regulator